MYFYFLYMQFAICYLIVNQLIKMFICLNQDFYKILGLSGLKYFCKLGCVEFTEV